MELSGRPECPACGDKNIDVLASRQVKVALRNGKQHFEGEDDHWVILPTSPCICTICKWEGCAGQLVVAR